MSFHGGNVYEFERLFGIGRNDIIDFSSNINPLGLSGLVKKELIKNINSITRYPDPDYADLKASIASYHKIDPGRIIAGNGASELIFLICRALKPVNVLIISPTFLEYENALSINGVKINHFKLMEEFDFNIDLQGLKRELKKRYGLVVICNPNNPTGGFIEKEEMEEIVLDCENNGSVILIDESFIDFISGSENRSSMNRIGKFENLLLVKSLTKFFAIPGLRLGFAAISDYKLKKKIEEIKEPWTINSMSEIAGINIFKDPVYIQKTKTMILEEKRFLYGLLSDIKQIKVFHPSVNFILIKILNDLTSDLLKNKLMEDRILIRDASNFRFLNNKFFRISVKNRKDNLYLIDKLVSRLNSDLPVFDNKTALF